MERGETGKTGEVLWKVPATDLAHAIRLDIGDRRRSESVAACGRTRATQGLVRGSHGVGRCFVDETPELDELRPEARGIERYEFAGFQNGRRSRVLPIIAVAGQCDSGRCGGEDTGEEDAAIERDRVHPAAPKDAAIRSARATIVSVGLEKPLTGKAAELQTYRLSVAWTRPLGSTTPPSGLSCMRAPPR